MSSCDNCGVSGVQLWRYYGGYPDHGQVLCSLHLGRNDFTTDCRKGPGVPANIKVDYVPAVVETGAEDTRGNVVFYSYADVPTDAADAWRSLPETLNAPAL